MERYINQLVNDLKAAKNWAQVNKPKNEISDSDLIAELEEIDHIIDEEPDIPMYKILGIDPVVFPPVEKLTNDQAALLAKEILELWQYFNFEAVYPENFPLHMLYSLLIRKFQEPIMYFPMGTTGIEFCNYDPNECPFGMAYCTCKDYASN
jgi:hypothetical protein